MTTVLTVDDSKVVRAMVAHGLQPLGCRVIEATNGREGLDAARQHRPDLVLLDVAMPVMDGRRALAELRADPATRDIAVIMLAVEGAGDDAAAFAQHGVVGWVVKPFQAATLAREVRKALKAASA